MTLKRAYASAALYWLSACLLFAALTLLTGAVFAIRDHRREDRIVAMSNTHAIRSLNEAQARALFHEYMELSRRWIPEPWVGYAEPVWHSAQINIDPGRPLPVRRTPRRAGNPRKTIWLFGGSTALGYNLPDSQTIAAHLSEDLDAEVINHAHLGFFSSQEVTLLQWLLRSGERADLAIFIDGVNDSGYGADRPAAGVEAAAEPMIRLSRRFPLVRLFSARRPAQPAPDVASIARRYQANLIAARATAAAFGVRTLFVWQPTPYDRLDVASNDEAARRVFTFFRWAPIFKPLNAAIRASISGPDFVDMTGVFSGRRFDETYIDSSHYGDMASALLARRIAEEILRRHLLDDRSDGSMNSATPAAKAR